MSHPSFPGGFAAWGFHPRHSRAVFRDDPISVSSPPDTGAVGQDPEHIPRQPPRVSQGKTEPHPKVWAPPGAAGAVLPRQPDRSCSHRVPLPGKPFPPPVPRTALPRHHQSHQEQHRSHPPALGHIPAKYQQLAGGRTPREWQEGGDGSQGLRNPKPWSIPHLALLELHLMFNTRLCTKNCLQRAQTSRIPSARALPERSHSSSSSRGG